MNKKGFTLFEGLLTIMILGSISTGFLIKQVEGNNQNKRIKFINEALSVVKAVDHRIAIDGYDPDLWSKLSWADEKDVVENLIKGELTSQYHDKCEGGSWKPALNSEHNTKLIECNLWGSRKNFGETISAQIRNDSSGFIQGFDLFINFEDEEDFKKYYKDIKFSLDKIKTNNEQELSGTFINGLVSTSTKKDISSYECISEPLDCTIKLSLERSGGNQYLRADGGNSMIGEHLSFVESKGESPLKCIRWSNTERDGSGSWTRQTDEDCGIGIYKATNQPVMVETVTDTGTFKNVLLDQDCVFYHWNGSEVVDTGTTRPCGMNNDGTEIYQVIPNISVQKLTSENSYATEMRTKNAYSDELQSTNIFSDAITTNGLISNKISADNLEAMYRLKTDLIESYTENGTIEVGSQVKLKDLVDFENKAYFSGEAYFNENVFMSKDSTIYGNLYASGNASSGTGIIQAERFSITDTQTEGNSCSTNGTLSKTSDGTLLNCVSKKWVKTIQDSSPIGTVVLWASTTIPSGWVEMKGQSTSSYPELKALIGSTIPDMRGNFARGWDNGRGYDSGRTFRSYQSDAIRNITGGMYYIAETWGAGPGYASGAFAKVTGYRGGKTPDKTDSSNTGAATFDASRVVPTAADNRPKNIALMYIIKVK